MISQDENLIKDLKIEPQIQQNVQNHQQSQRIVEGLLAKSNSNIQNARQNIKKRYGSVLFQNKIQIINDAEQSDELQIEVVQVSKDWKMFKLQIKYRQYCFSNIDMSLHCLKHKTTGTYGSVYFIKVNNKDYAIKCIQLEYQSDFQDKFQDIIKEYLFNKLASALKVGPKIIEEQLGFSIFIYHDCIEFAMELCEQINHYSKQAQIDLRESLEILHDFKIIHYDVKIGNICYSPAYAKHILIDFGLSEIAKTQKHQKQYVQFRGTFSYCSNQMKKLYLSKNKKQFINLYENDMHGLNETIKQLQKLIPLKQVKSPRIFIIKGYYQYYLVISHLFNNHKKKEMKAFFKQFLKDKQKIKQYSQCIFSTINSLRYSQNIRNLFSQYTSQFSQFIYLIKQTNYTLSLRKEIIICKELLQDNNTEIQHKFKLILSKYLSAQSQINQRKNQLKSQNLAKLIDSQTYLLQVAQYIKVQSKICTYEEKLTICSVFLKIYAHLSIKEQHQINKATFNYFCQFCMKGQINQLKIKIVQDLIASFLLFELISEKQYLQFFSKVLSKCKHINKLLQSKLFIIRYLCAVEWIRYRIVIGKYDYWHLKKQIWIIFCKFMSQLQYQHPFKDILLIIKTIKEINNLNQFITNKNINLYKINQPQKAINLQSLKVTLPRQYSPQQISIQAFSVQQIVAYGLKFDIQIIEDYYNNLCSKMHEKLQQFQLEAKELIYFLINQMTEYLKEAQQFKKLNQFHLQSKQKKTAKYYFQELSRFAQRWFQYEYQNFIIEFHLRTFKDYQFYDGLLYALQYKYKKQEIIRNQEYNDYIEKAFFNYLTGNNFIDWYLIQQYYHLAVHHCYHCASGQIKYKILEKLIGKLSQFEGIIVRKIFAIAKYNQQKFHNQYLIMQDLIYMREIIIIILQQYPQRTQHLLPFIKMSFNLPADIALSIKYQLLIYLYCFRQSLFILQNLHQILFQQYLNLGIFVLKINNYRIINSTMDNHIYNLINPNIRKYVNRFLLYCIKINKRLILQQLLDYQNRRYVNQFRQLFLSLYQDKDFQQMIQIIKVIIQFAECHGDKFYLSLIHKQFGNIHCMMTWKQYQQSYDQAQQYANTVLVLLNWQNPFLSFYLIALLCFDYKQKQKDRKIYLFICRSLDKLNSRRIKSMLERQLFQLFYLKESIIIRHLRHVSQQKHILMIKNKRHRRYIACRLLKKPIQQEHYDQQHLIFQDCLKIIIKPKNKSKFNCYYRLFFLKLGRSYQNINHQTIKGLFKLKKKRFFDTHDITDSK